MRTFTRKSKRHLAQPGKMATTSFGAVPAGRIGISQILNGSRLQPKLKVGAPNDAYEQEADRVADQVMRMPDAPEPSIAKAPENIQRVCNECEEEIQRQPMEEEETLQSKTLPGRTSDATMGAEAAAKAVKEGGSEMDGKTRSFFEPRFGRDFSSVRVHTGEKAAEAATAINARAFTLGNNIVFNQDQYSPKSTEGRRLLAHELTHVVQQSGKMNRGNSAQMVQAQPAPQESATTTASNISLKFWVNGFIPNTITGGQRVPKGPKEGQTMFQGPFWISDCFMTDNREFSNDPEASSRTHLEAVIDLPSGRILDQDSWSSGTTELDCEDGVIECARVANVPRTVEPISSESSVHKIRIKSKASDPCFTGAAEIDVNGFIFLDSLSRIFVFGGLVDPFPAYEMYISVNEGPVQEIFTYFDKSKTAWDIQRGGGNHKVSGSTRF